MILIGDQLFSTTPAWRLMEGYGVRGGQRSFCLGATIPTWGWTDFPLFFCLHDRVPLWMLRCPFLLEPSTNGLIPGSAWCSGVLSGDDAGIRDVRSFDFLWPNSLSKATVDEEKKANFSTPTKALQYPKYNPGEPLISLSPNNLGQQKSLLLEDLRCIESELFPTTTSSFLKSLIGASTRGLWLQTVDFSFLALSTSTIARQRNKKFPWVACISGSGARLSCTFDLVFAFLSFLEV